MVSSHCEHYVRHNLSYWCRHHNMCQKHYFIDFIYPDLWYACCSMRITIWLSSIVEVLTTNFQTPVHSSAQCFKVVDSDMLSWNCV